MLSLHEPHLVAIAKGKRSRAHEYGTSKVSISIHRNGYVVGHLKSDHPRPICSRYRGFEADKKNVSWAVIAWNTKNWVRRGQGSGKKAQGMGENAV